MTKNLSTGEGGMITTNSNKLYEKIKNLRNLSFGKKNRFNHEDISSNNRMSNIQATLGLSQLNRINKIVKRREFIGKQYYEFLKKNPNLYIPEPSRKFVKNIYWVVGVLITNTKLKIDAQLAMKKLKDKGIGTRPFLCHKQKMLKKYSFTIQKNLRIRIMFVNMVFIYLQV